MDNVAHFGTTG